MLAVPDLVVETGDRLVVLAPTTAWPRVRAHFGDSIRGNAEFSYISVGIGMVLGLALGALPLPIPGLGTLSLGVAAGPLIVALILGWLGRTGPIGWRIPAPANLVLRNLGLDAVPRLGRDRGRPTLRNNGFHAPAFRSCWPARRCC